MSEGEAAGIAIGVIVLIAIVIGAGFLFERRRRSQNGHESVPVSFDNPSYSGMQAAVEAFESEGTTITNSET